MLFRASRDLEPAAAAVKAALLAGVDGAQWVLLICLTDKGGEGLAAGETGSASDLFEKRNPMERGERCARAFLEAQKGERRVNTPGGAAAPERITN